MVEGQQAASLLAWPRVAPMLLPLPSLQCTNPLNAMRQGKVASQCCSTHLRKA